MRVNHTRPHRADAWLLWVAVALLILAGANFARTFCDVWYCGPSLWKLFA